MATSTLGNGTLVLAGTTSGTTTVTATAVAGTTTLTLPAATDTLVGKATTDTLTNKTLTTPSISTPTITGTALSFDGSQLGIGTASGTSNGLKLNSGNAGANYVLYRASATGLLTIYGNQTGFNGLSVTGVDGDLATLSSTGLKTKTTISVGDATPSSYGAGITFPATQSASSDANTLDDYEEGTWTPNLFSAGGGNPTFTSSGVYTKVGNLVTLIGKITLTSTAGSIGYYIDGFPFGVSSTTAKESAYGTETTGTVSMAIIFANTTTLFMVKYDGTFYGASGYDYRICLQFTV